MATPLATDVAKKSVIIDEASTTFDHHANPQEKRGV
jgi:hypothetical protein